VNPDLRNLPVAVRPGRRGTRGPQRLRVFEPYAEHGLYLLPLEPEVSRRGVIADEEYVLELPVEALRYPLLRASRPKRHEAVGADAQPQLLLDLPQAVEGLLSRRQVPARREVHVPRPGVLRRGAALHEEVGFPGAGIDAEDPAMNAPVPQPAPVRLALPGDPAGRLPGLRVPNVDQLVHAPRLAPRGGIASRKGLS
jgi:hypothetical protein